MSEPRTNRGRPPYGKPKKPRAVKSGFSLPPDVFARLTKYCDDEERDKSWVIKKALDVWLKDRGY